MKLKPMSKLLNLIFLFSIFTVSFCSGQPDSKNSSFHTFKIEIPNDLKDFFSYSNDRIPMVCAHRGGDRKLFPENCIATFENTLSEVNSMIEIDPRYTKDSIIVLMHDPTLERTSNGKGKVCDYTYDELKKLRLKDAWGNLTDYRIPTLDETLEWAKSKTILVLDRKDVPVEVRVKKIEEHNALANAMVIAYSIDEIKKCYMMNPDIMMEIMLGDITLIKSFEEAGVPWRNIVGFVSHNLNIDPAIFDLIHKKGAMCIVGSSRNYDLKYKSGEIKSFKELSDKYRMMIMEGADIIEADLAIEAGLSIKDLVPVSKSISKKKFYNQ